MPGFDGTGPNGNGPMTGRGMGHCVIPLNNPEQELGFLKNQVQALSEYLKKIKNRMSELESTGKRVSSNTRT